MVAGAFVVLYKYHINTYKINFSCLKKEQNTTDSCFIIKTQREKDLEKQTI